MDMATQVQILDKVVCNLHRKGMNPVILPPAMGKY